MTLSIDQRKARSLLRFGRKLATSGKLTQACSCYQQGIAADPTYYPNYVQLATLYFKSEQWSQALTICQQGLSHNPHLASLHKIQTTIYAQQNKLDTVYDHYQLRLIGPAPNEIAAHEIICCSVVRNEAQRVPFFLQYYRNLGVDRFFFVDNGSTDQTVAYLMAQPDVHIWQSQLSFNLAACGSVWLDLLMRRYCVDHWVILADADELLVYADSETRSIQAFCDMLMQHNKVAANALLLDMYSNRPISQTPYVTGEDFRTVCRFFDPTGYDQRHKLLVPNKNGDALWGGVRQRVFPAAHNYLLSKSPLVYYQPQTIVYSGQHYTNAPIEQIAHEICVVQHFKFFASFAAYTQQEMRREEYPLKAEQYKTYADKLTNKDAIILYDPKRSTAYEGTRQLADLGLLQQEPGDYHAIQGRD